MTRSQAGIKLTPEVLEGLQELGSVNRVLQCTYNFIACHVDLRGVGDIEKVMDFHMERLDMVEPRVIIFSSKAGGGGLLCHRWEAIDRGGQGDIRLLSSTDMRIVHQLSLDGRMPISTIAYKTGLTPRR